MDCLKNCGLRRRRQSLGLKALALQSLSFARIHADGRTQKIEEELEKEIERENEEHTTWLSKLRHHGEKMMTSKAVLLTIVALNVIDCVLVLGELILDVNYVVGILDTTEKTTQSFIDKMEVKHNDSLSKETTVDILYNKLLRATIIWDKPAALGRKLYKRSVDVTGSLLNESFSVQMASINETDLKFYSVHDYEHEHSLEEKIAHAFHKASIAILTVLVLATLVKIFCEGMEILKKKLELFDGFVVFVSFTLDLVFIKGLTTFKIQQYVFILAILVPWRVIRVVNSLVVAVIDHEHFRLKLLYSQKKQINTQLKQEKKDNKRLQECVNTLLRLCTAEGIPEAKVKRHIALYQANKKKSSFLKNLPLVGGSTSTVSEAKLSIEDEEEKNSVVDMRQELEDKLKATVIIATSLADAASNGHVLHEEPENQSEIMTNGNALQLTESRDEESPETPFLKQNGSCP